MQKRQNKLAAANVANAAAIEYCLKYKPRIMQDKYCSCNNIVIYELLRDKCGVPLSPPQIAVRRVFFNRITKGTFNLPDAVLGKYFALLYISFDFDRIAFELSDNEIWATMGGSGGKLKLPQNMRIANFDYGGIDAEDEQGRKFNIQIKNDGPVPRLGKIEPDCGQLQLERLKKFAPGTAKTIQYKLVDNWTQNDAWGKLIWLDEDGSIWASSENAVFCLELHLQRKARKLIALIVVSGVNTIFFEDFGGSLCCVSPDTQVLDITAATGIRGAKCVNKFDDKYVLVVAGEDEIPWLLNCEKRTAIVLFAKHPIFAGSELDWLRKKRLPRRKLAAPPRPANRKFELELPYDFDDEEWDGFPSFFYQEIRHDPKSGKVSLFDLKRGGGYEEEMPPWISTVQHPKYLHAFQDQCIFVMRDGAALHYYPRESINAPQFRNLNARHGFGFLRKIVGIRFRIGVVVIDDAYCLRSLGYAKHEPKLICDSNTFSSSGRLIMATWLSDWHSNLIVVGYDTGVYIFDALNASKETWKIAKGKISQAISGCVIITIKNKQFGIVSKNAGDETCCARPWYSRFNNANKNCLPKFSNPDSGSHNIGDFRLVEYTKGE